MPGSTPTDYLDALKWGTSTGGAAGNPETTLTLGTDRLDFRVPPSQYHVAGLQLARFRNLLQTMSTYFKGGTRLQVLTQTDSPFGSGEYGFYVDANGMPRMHSNTSARFLQNSSLESLTFSATPTFNFNLNNSIVMTLTGNITSYTMTNGIIGGQTGTLILVQDGAGSRTLAAAPANVKLAGGSLTLTTTGGKRDCVSFIWDNVASVWQETARALNA